MTTPQVSDCLPRGCRNCLWRRHVRKISASIPSALDVPGAGQGREERCPGRGAHGARRAPLYSMHCDGRSGFQLSRARDGNVLAPEMSREHIAIIRRAYGVHIVEDRWINVAGLPLERTTDFVQAVLDVAAKCHGTTAHHLSGEVGKGTRSWSSK
jgi:hypothetical protein